MLWQTSPSKYVHTAALVCAHCICFGTFFGAELTPPLGGMFAHDLARLLEGFLGPCNMRCIGWGRGTFLSFRK